MGWPRTSSLKLFLFTLVSLVSVCIASDIDALIKFKESLGNPDALNNWNPSTNPCRVPKWVGVTCTNGIVWGLRLENMSLSGEIDIDALVELTPQSISLHNNSFEGSWPDFKRIGALKALYLSYNMFSGAIPDDAFNGMKMLKKIHLENNAFTGNIPTSLLGLRNLMELGLQGNRFQGQIPDFQQDSLTMVNVAFNQLDGKIPERLSTMDPSYFAGKAGNKDLCGDPLKACTSKKSLVIAIIVIAVGVLVLASIIALLLIKLHRQHHTQKAIHLKKVPSAKIQKDTDYDGGRKHAIESPEHQQGGGGGEQGKLCFVRSDREKFDLQDLLRASAEVLGSGSFGSSYKASLLSGPVVVVKRFKQMSSVRREDFHEHMKRLGRLRHPNLLPLLAYYHRKEEKLVVSDFVENGSLASHLHGEPHPDQPGLDWPTRLKILKGVARGLLYLYNEFPNITVAHGHLKSSNVLLDNAFEPLLSDYALIPITNRDHAQQFMIAYKSPESNQYNRLSRKTDVWSLGILILEMLTGKFQTNHLKEGSDSNADLATWVNSVVREEWTGEVFDKDMRGTKNGEGEMLKLLKIALCCCEVNLERRWDLRMAVEKIEELKERDSDEDYSTYASEEDVYSSRAMTDEDFSFSVTR
ncbi:Protein kinase domain [Dillenia turbinata]|uniref:non-specific serine/threonine protein kinase n=1 Tax=Dillenia turbinata TaxID=194707 RepID=A0AAN8VA31_9MAGN